MQLKINGNQNYTRNKEKKKKKKHAAQYWKIMHGFTRNAFLKWCINNRQITHALISWKQYLIREYKSPIASWFSTFSNVLPTHKYTWNVFNCLIMFLPPKNQTCHLSCPRRTPPQSPWKGGQIDQSRHAILFRDYNKKIAWTTHRNSTVIDDNFYCYPEDLFEGDIVLDNDTRKAIAGETSHRGALSSTDESRWPDNTVPYIFSFLLCE